MSLTFLYDFLYVFCSDWLLEDIEFAGVEDNDLVVLGDQKNLVFFHVLTKCNLTLIHPKRVRFHPFTFYYNLSTNELVNFSQCQEIHLIAESVSKY